MKKILPIIAGAMLIAPSAAHAAEKLKVLIVDGQNNHAAWPKSTIIMSEYLKETGLFEVDIARTKFTWNGKQEAAFLPLAGVGPTEDLPKAKTDPDFKPDFSKYRVVISNFGFKPRRGRWKPRRPSKNTCAKAVASSPIHAADNCFSEWPEFNRMIGLGGWGGRNEKHGPYVYIDRDGKVVRDPKPGPCGTHGPHNDFLITTRSQTHPVTKGLPELWMHASDECYSLLRGPAENLEILATASEPQKLRDEGRNEPMLMAIGYHKGRVFHTTLGHHAESSSASASRSPSSAAPSGPPPEKSR